ATHRVTGGSHLPPVPTERGVRISRTTLFGEHDILWQDELWRTVPTSTVEDQQGDGTDADAFADFGQMLVHGVDTDDRHDPGGTGAARRADGAEQIALRWPFQQAPPAGTFGQLRPGEPPVAPDAPTRAALGPDAGQRALLANAGGMSQRFQSAKRFGMANGGFILKPDFDRPAGKLWRDCGTRQLSEVFLKASCASSSLCGCTGLTDMLLKFSFFSSLPMLRSCR